MASGKVHGGGGHGREWRERRRSYAHEIAAREGIIRQQAKRARYFERKWILLSEHFNAKITPVAQNAIAKVKAAINSSRKPMSAREGILKILAIDEWHFEEGMKKAKELHIEEQIAPEDFRILKYEDRKKYRELLIGKAVLGGKSFTGINPKQMNEEIKKWKGRVPKMAQGMYI